MAFDPWKTYLSTTCHLTSELWEPMGLLYIHQYWRPVLQNEFAKPYFLELCEFIAKERRKTCPIYPAPEQTFAWTNGCAPNQVKVVIVGQDPYYKPEEANGYAFSTDTESSRPPSSSRLFLNLKRDESLNFTDPDHSNLFGWARQGVLLLNTVLTVRKGKPNSHSSKRKGVSVHWDYLTTSVIDYIAYCNTGVVFILLGKQAWSLIPLIALRIPWVPDGIIPRHLIFFSFHPVYNSCRCQGIPKDHTPDCLNFGRCHPFSNANTFLKLHHGPNGGIDWNALALSAEI